MTTDEPQFEVQIHCHRGADESFEADTLSEAQAIMRDAVRDSDTRLVLIIDVETGQVVEEADRG